MYVYVCVYSAKLPIIIMKCPYESRASWYHATTTTNHHHRRWTALYHENKYKQEKQQQEKEELMEQPKLKLRYYWYYHHDHHRRHHTIITIIIIIILFHFTKQRASSQRGNTTRYTHTSYKQLLYVTLTISSSSPLRLRLVFMNAQFPFSPHQTKQPLTLKFIFSAFLSSPISFLYNNMMW